MIEILNYEPVQKKSIIGFVDIKLPKWNNLIIRRIMHIQGQDGKKWFKFPSFSKEKPDGTKEYFCYFEFELNAHSNHILGLLSEPVKKFCLENKIAEISDISEFVPPNFEDGELPF